MEVPGDGLGVSLFLIIEAKISDSLFPNIVTLFIKLTRYIGYKFTSYNFIF